MAKLSALPAQHIIDGFKGTIDFYEWLGIPVARQWPRSPGPRRATSVEAQWPAWSYATRIWNTLTPPVQRAYVQLAAGTGLSGRDLSIRAYLTGLYRYPTGP